MKYPAFLSIRKFLLTAFSLICASCVNAADSKQFDATIPVIDMNDYYSKTSHDKFISQLADAMQKVGFVAIINSRIDREVLDDSYAAIKTFYAQPKEYKMLGNDPKLNGQRGYVQSETAKGQNAKDFKEFYHIGRDYPAEIQTKYGYPKNIWPDDGAYKQAMQKLIVALDREAEVIGAALAESIGEDPDLFNNLTRHGNYVMRSIHYPSNPPVNLVWAAAHTDIDLFTILPRATERGLQVLNAQNEWVDVIVPDGAFIVNAGDMLQNITNGVYKSSVHRVVSKDKNVERYSVVAFIHARPQDNMQPLAKFVDQIGTQKFAALTAEELLAERLIDLGLHSKELLNKFAKSGAIEKLIAVKRASPGAMKVLRDANLASNSVLEELATQ